MILKGYIKSLPSKGSNIFRVRIPFLEDNTSREMIFDSLLCNQPGEYAGYEVGDCVFVIFENDKLNTPVILGKLFVEENKNVKTHHIVNDLEVTGNVILPDNTMVGGYTIEDIFKLQQAASIAEHGEELPYNYELVGTWTA